MSLMIFLPVAFLLFASGASYARRSRSDGARRIGGGLVLLVQPTVYPAYDFGRRNRGHR